MCLNQIGLRIQNHILTILGSIINKIEGGTFMTTKWAQEFSFW